MSIERGIAYKPTEHADMLGLRVEHGRLPADRKGQYVHDDRIIVIRRGLSARQERCTLAHEVAHAVAGDVRSAFGPVNARQEARADRLAAWWLIDEREYAAAEMLHGPHRGAIADELDVTLHMLRVWRRAHALVAA